MNFHDMKQARETRELPPIPAEPKTIDVTPTWGEIGLLFCRLATSKEVAAIKAGRSEFARAFAMAQAFSELNATLTEEQKALASKVLAAELTKQRF